MAAHAMVFPFPVQGHVNSMLKLAELLSIAGLNVTFLNTEHNHQRLRRFSSAYARLAKRPGFRFESISDGLPDDDPRSVSRVLDLEKSLSTRSRPLFQELLTSYARRLFDERPPVTCAVVDGLMPFATDVAEDVGIPAIVFETVSPCAFWAYYSFPKLIECGELPFPEDADLDVSVNGVPGMEGLLRRRDLPSFCRLARHQSDHLVQLVINSTTRTTRARALILNTFETLDAPILSHIRTQCPTTYTIGPIHTLLRSFATTRHPGNDGGESVTSESSPNASAGNLWPEDRTCMMWLDSQPVGSVVYVSFGSLAALTRVQLLELWHGLVNSCARFLWVMRPDLIQGETADLEPPAELKAATKERGCLVGWGPQEEVLAHPAVGCFLTHSGWNSTLEAAAAGVPMICWPTGGDQQTNSRFVGEVWRIGLDMKDVCERDIVEKMVREVMQGERAAELRRSTEETAEMARRSVAEGGSSFMNFQKLVEYIQSKCSDVK